MSPTDAGALIGREDDVRELLASLEQPGLVCVVGAAGVGKTTLARQLARALTEAGREVLWCDASGADPLALVADAARVAGVPLPAGLALEAALRGAARALDGPRVLVLDDLDLRSKALASAARELARLAPRLSLLVTARGSGGADRVHRLRPLALSATGEGVLESECGRAWQMFVRRRGGRASISPQEAALLWEILGELDGLPLAIELAAARASVLSSAEILRALRRDRFELLRSEEDGHTTAGLERAIAASFRALGEPERRLLEICSLFPGGFSIALLERVTDEPHLLDVLGLVDPSLVTRAAEGGERAWFMLPSSVRAFAGRELDRRGDRTACTTRLRAAYAAELESLTVNPVDRLRTNAQLEEERENLLALTSHTTAADAESTLRAIGALQGFYWTEGLTDGQSAALESALASAPQASPLTIARALAFRGRVRRRRGDAHAEADLRRAIALAESAGFGEVAALAGRELGWLFIAHGRFEECEAALASAEASARTSPYAAAWILLVRSQLDRHHGRLELGRERATGAMLAFRRMHARFDETLALLETSEQCLMTGENVRAQQMCETGFALASEMGASGASLAANFFVMLAAAKLEAGDYAGSMDAVDQARARSHALDDTVMETAASAVEVLVHWGSGAVAVARAVVSRVIPDLTLRGDRIWGGFFVALEGAMAAELGHELEAETALARAARDFPEASAYRAAIRLCMGHLELLRGRRALAAGRAKEATHHLNLAIAIAAAARAPGPDGTLSDAARLFETRLVLRVLDEAIARFSAANAPAPTARSLTLTLEREAHWLEIDGARVSLDKRPVLRKLLLDLSRERVAHPGRALSAEHLIAVGWPGERMIHSSAISRLRMAISRLRAVGLASMLRTEGDGYYLDETVRVAFVDE